MWAEHQGWRDRPYLTGIDRGMVKGIAASSRCLVYHLPIRRLETIEDIGSAAAAAAVVVAVVAADVSSTTKRKCYCATQPGPVGLVVDSALGRERPKGQKTLVVVVDRNVAAIAESAGFVAVELGCAGSGLETG